jgi:hypothetical protein
LSEHEQRLLEQIERALYAEDPKFASAVRSTDLRSVTIRRVLRGLLLLIVGIALLVLGVASHLIPVGVMGFIIMFGSVVYMLTDARPKALPNPSHPDHLRSRTAGVSSGRRSVRNRMEERWQRRWEERDR